MITAIGKQSPEQRVHVQRAMPYLKGIVDGSGLTDMLKEMQEIQESEIELLKKTEKTLVKISSGSTRRKTLQNLRKIEINQRARILQFLEPHLDKIEDECVRYVINGLVKIQENQLEENIERLIALFQRCNEEIADEVFDRWTKKDPNEMVELLKLIQPFLIKKFNPESRINLVKAIQVLKIVDEDYEGILEAVIPVLDEIPNTYHFYYLVLCLSLFNDQERMQARNKLIPLFLREGFKHAEFRTKLIEAGPGNRMQILDLTEMLEGMVTIQESEIEELEEAKKTLTKISSGSTRLKTLKTIIEIKRNDRAGILQFIEPYLDRIADPCVQDVLRCLTWIPKDQYLEHIEQLIALYQGCSDEIANQIWETEFHKEIAKRLKLIQPVLFKHFEPATRPTLLIAIKEISYDPQVLEAVTPVLKKILNADHFANVVKGLKLFETKQKKEQARDKLIPLFLREGFDPQDFLKQLEKTTKKARMQKLIHA